MAPHKSKVCHNDVGSTECSTFVKVGVCGANDSIGHCLGRLTSRMLALLPKPQSAKETSVVVSILRLWCTSETSRIWEHGEADVIHDRVYAHEPVSFHTY